MKQLMKIADTDDLDQSGEINDGKSKTRLETI
jgi:hypothetical protein